MLPVVRELRRRAQPAICDFGEHLRTRFCGRHLHPGDRKPKLALRVRHVGGRHPPLLGRVGASRADFGRAADRRPRLLLARSPRGRDGGGLPAILRFHRRGQHHVHQRDCGDRHPVHPSGRRNHRDGGGSGHRLVRHHLRGDHGLRRVPGVRHHVPLPLRRVDQRARAHSCDRSLHKHVLHRIACVRQPKPRGLDLPRCVELQHHAHLDPHR